MGVSQPIRVSHVERASAGRRSAARATARPPGREKLLRAAAALFAESGYDGVTTRQILERAGVEAPSLYHHFGSKLGLYRAVLTENNEPFLLDLQRRSRRLRFRRGTSTRSRLAALIWAIFQGGLRNPEAVQIALFEAHRPGPTRYDVIGIWERLRDAFRSVIEDGARSGELGIDRARSEVAAHLLIGGLTSYMQLFVLGRQRLTRRLAREIVETLLDGIAKTAEPRPARRQVAPPRSTDGSTWTKRRAITSDGSDARTRST